MNMQTGSKNLFLLLACALLLCSPIPLRSQTASPTNALPPTVHPLKADGIENFFQLTDTLYSGSAPETEATFVELSKRGFKTIITVDGAKPDVETAKRHGIRYVHLPIGYDGVPIDQGIRLVKAAETMPGPIYIHCHHGLHRGPAGAAVICMATKGWTPEQADAWLRVAGTSTNYAGLYKSVAQFQPPSAETLKNISSQLPEKSDISPVAETMVHIDERFDNLKLIKKAGYKKSASHPDIDPAHEALLLNELFKEMLRLPTTNKIDKDFQAKLSEAERAAQSLHLLLKTSPVSLEQAEVAFQRINTSCSACHKAHRN